MTAYRFISIYLALLFPSNFTVLGETSLLLYLDHHHLSSLDVTVLGAVTYVRQSFPQLMVTAIKV
jgi:hypothetical protein